MTQQISLEVNGKEYDGFRDVYIERNLDTLASSFSFIATKEIADTFTWWAVDNVRILINGSPVVNGYIDRLETISNDNDYTVRFTGRSKTADLVDSYLTGQLQFKTPITLKSIIETVLKDIDLNIEVKQTIDVPAFTASEKISAKRGDKALDFIMKYARQRQVLLTNDGDGNILITRNAEKATDTLLLNRQNGANNNIIESNASYDGTNRFYQYKVYAQPENDISKFSGYSSSATDANIRHSRHYVAIEDGLSSADIKDMAKWLAKNRRDLGFSYSCSVSGFKFDMSDKAIWQPNMIVQVQDDFAFVNKKLLIKSVRYQYTEDKAITSLTLVREYSYMSSNKLEKYDIIEPKKTTTTTKTDTTQLQSTAYLDFLKKEVANQEAK